MEALKIGVQFGLVDSCDEQCQPGKEKRALSSRLPTLVFEEPRTKFALKGYGTIRCSRGNVGVLSEDPFHELALKD